MSEPNSLKLRTIIMVASMIALPLAAVIGIKLPAFMRTESGWRAEGSRSSAPAQRPIDADTARKPTAAAHGTARPNDPQPAAPAVPVAHATNIDVLPESPSVVRPAGGFQAEDTPSATKPAAHFETTRDVPPDAEFTYVQQRLRALGATHYALETCGSSGDAYRFQCRMAAGHDAHYSRHFEATDTEPLRAMRTVLEEVESWKSGRLP